MVKRRADRIRHAAQKQRIAVGGGGRDRFAPDVASGAGPVLDDDLLAPEVRQARGDDACRKIGAAAGRRLLDLFGGSPRLLVSNLLETGTITLQDLKALQGALPRKATRRRGGKGHA